MNHLPERDWKVARDLKNELLGNACARILKEVRSIAEADVESSHTAYLKLWKLMQREDEKIGVMFDDLKRSNCISKTAAWLRFGLLTNEHLAQFTETTQESIRFVSRLR